MARLEGDLSLMPLGDAIIWLANRRRSGTLTVEHETIRKVFTIDDGMAVRASSNDPRDYFGQFLVHFGLVTEDQLQRAFETQTETKVLLGRILVMIGIVPEEHVIQVLRVKISESMLDGMRWMSGRFSFDDVAPPEERPEIGVAVPVVDIHREGVLRSDIWAELGRILPDRSNIISVRESSVPPSVTPESLDGRILALARLGLNVEAITLELHATDFQVAARLLELYRVGAIEPREPSTEQLVPALTSPQERETHLDLANTAVQEGRFSEALRHVREGARQDPNNTEFGRLHTDIEAKAREATAHQPARESVPVLTGRLTAMKTKQMTAKQRYVLARIDGKRTVNAIIQVSPMHDIEALEIIRQFESEQVVRFMSTDGGA